MTSERSPVGANIRLARQEAGLTNDQLAFKAGIPVRYLHHWQSGKHEPTLANLRKVANVFGHDLAWFYVERQEVPA